MSDFALAEITLPNDQFPFDIFSAQFELLLVVASHFVYQIIFTKQK